MRHFDSPVRSLKDLCLSVLISPQKPNDLPPLLDKYYWDPPRRGIPHPLLDASAMHELIPNIDEADLERVLQLLRSCSNHHLYSKRHNPSQSPETVDPFPRSHRASPSDDASTNPYYLACPSSRHLEVDGSSTLAPRRHLFVHAHKGGEADHDGPVRPNNLKIDERNQVRNGTDRKTLMKMSFSHVFSSRCN